MNNKKRIVVAMTAMSKKSDAQKIARYLVLSGLAGCVNIIKIDSVFRWKQNIEREKEYLLLIKTFWGEVKKLEKEIIKRHPYKVPEFAVLKITSINRSYFDWFREVIKSD